MSTDPTALAREVLDDELGWEVKPGDLMHPEDKAATYRLANAAPALARAVIAVSELHQPIRVYDDCGDPECLNDHEWFADTVACEDSAIGWACARCCYHGEHPLECADHKGDHKGVTADQACSTRTALNGENA